ncbi:unnamed protein product [Pleuronectes platessa]|uniref:Uncharacterized protein n=1 Tax=Pleuronectes platessa TaxID=8262 RepID=A0A9N7VE11_PLEPL|nr:unnamed protein product [Pleuronectes platessa]
MLTEWLTAAGEEILARLEETFAQYEDREERSQLVISRQRRLLDDVMKDIVQLQRAVCPADVQQLMVNKEEVPPEQQQWSPLVDRVDPEPPHIKEEQEEPWTNQDGQQLQGLEEADIKFTLTPVAVKSEEDEEKLKSSKLHPSETKENRADCGGPEPARNSAPDGHLKQGTEDKTEVSSETEDRTQSDSTFIDEEVANQLQADAYPVKLKLTTMLGENTIVKSQRVIGLRGKGGFPDFLTKQQRYQCLCDAPSLKKTTFEPTVQDAMRFDGKTRDGKKKIYFAACDGINDEQRQIWTSFRQLRLRGSNRSFQFTPVSLRGRGNTTGPIYRQEQGGKTQLAGGGPPTLSKPSSLHRRTQPHISTALASSLFISAWDTSSPSGRIHRVCMLPVVMHVIILCGGFICLASPQKAWSPVG